MDTGLREPGDRLRRLHAGLQEPGADGGGLDEPQQAVPDHHGLPELGHSGLGDAGGRDVGPPGGRCMGQSAGRIEHGGLPYPAGSSVAAAWTAGSCELGLLGVQEDPQEGALQPGCGDLRRLAGPGAPGLHPHPPRRGARGPGGPGRVRVLLGGDRGGGAQRLQVPQRRAHDTGQPRSQGR
eukprot:15481631-Alexandrium_andersonii.AAC.1